MLDSNTPCPREYVSYRTNHNPQLGSHGGSLVYMGRDVPHVPINLNTELEAVAVCVDLNRKYTICSLYLTKQPSDKRRYDRPHKPAPLTISYPR